MQDASYNHDEVIIKLFYHFDPVCILFSGMSYFLGPFFNSLNILDYLPFFLPVQTTIKVIFW